MVNYLLRDLALSKGFWKGYVLLTTCNYVNFVYFVFLIEVIKLINVRYFHLFMTKRHHNVVKCTDRALRILDYNNTHREH